jgi:hypothetical protein
METISLAWRIATIPVSAATRTRSKMEIVSHS